MSALTPIEKTRMARYIVGTLISAIVVFVLTHIVVVGIACFYAWDFSAFVSPSTWSQDARGLYIFFQVVAIIVTHAYVIHHCLIDAIHIIEERNNV